MNQIETWFGVLSGQAVDSGSFRSVRELIAMIEAFTARWNEGSTPFVWVKTADQILAKAVRKPRAISESGHQHNGSGLGASLFAAATAPRRRDSALPAARAPY